LASHSIAAAERKAGAEGLLPGARFRSFPGLVIVASTALGRFPPCVKTSTPPF
jgi:hypothetical protein